MERPVRTSRWSGSTHRRRADRGATLVEYSLGVALVCIASLGALQFLEDGATDEYGDRADRSGAPDLAEASDGGGTGGSSTGGSDGTDSEVPPQEVFFGGFTTKSSGNNPWTAKVEVLVSENPDGSGKIEGARVTGTWTYLAGATTVTQDVTCDQTSNQGKCLFQLSDIPNSANDVTFTMTGITGGVPPVEYYGEPQQVVVAR